MAAIAQQLERQIVPPFSAIEADLANGVFSELVSLALPLVEPGCRAPRLRAGDLLPR